MATNCFVWTRYLSEDKLLICRHRLVSFPAQLDSQVSADVVTGNTSCWIPRVIADLTVHGEFKELWVEMTQPAFNLDHFM